MRFVQRGGAATGPSTGGGDSVPPLGLDLAQSTSCPWGMAVSVAMCRLPLAGAPVGVFAGYEDGSVALWGASSPALLLLRSRLHTDPVMSLAVAGASVGCSDASSGPGSVLGKKGDAGL